MMAKDRVFQICDMVRETKKYALSDRSPKSSPLLSWLLSFLIPFASPCVFCGHLQAQRIEMPERGICAHRGASDTHPENTLAAFRAAIRLGAQMIEFDVALSKDKKLVLLHDNTVDRTTNGQGPVADLTLAELKALDAGSWKHQQFAGERVPELSEALAMMPENIWLNVHLKGGAELAERVARTIVAGQRLHQAFLACDAAGAAAAKRVAPGIQVCNMERQANSLAYVKATIAMKADFIQLLGGNANPAHTKLLRERGIRVNYCCTDEAEKVRQLFAGGVEFPLVDRLGDMLRIADEAGVERLQPVYRSRLQLPSLQTPTTVLLEQRRLDKGSASQGLALMPQRYFTSTATSIFRYDNNWQFLDEKAIRIEGVNHIGAIDYHDGFLWAGLLHGPENGKHDPKLNRSIIAKISASSLEVVATWDITKDVTWIDPVCFDGRYLWVGDLSDLGIHRYRFDGDQLVGDGILRYPKAMHFSQGIRVVGRRLYSIHTFGNMDGLFEFELPEALTDEVQQPARVWSIPENQMHLEGFDFDPDKPGQIWHAQGRQVDRIELSGIANAQ